MDSSFRLLSGGHFFSPADRPEGEFYGVLKGSLVSVFFSISHPLRTTKSPDFPSPIISPELREFFPSRRIHILPFGRQRKALHIFFHDIPNPLENGVIKRNTFSLQEWNKMVVLGVSFNNDSVKYGFRDVDWCKQEHIRTRIPRKL